MKKKPIHLLGYQEIADELGVKVNLIRVWVIRGKLPEPDYRLGQSPGWLEETIRPWINKQKKTPAH